MGILDIASYASKFRGYDYYKEKHVLEFQKIGEQEFQAKVKGSSGQTYDVYLNEAHPKKSTCNCPYATGKSIVCKHKVAVYFTANPQEAKVIEDYYKEEERKERAWQEAQYQHSVHLKNYVEGLTADQAKQVLLGILGELSASTLREYGLPTAFDFLDDEFRDYFHEEDEDYDFFEDDGY